MKLRARFLQGGVALHLAALLCVCCSSRAAFSMWPRAPFTFVETRTSAPEGVPISKQDIRGLVRRSDLIARVRVLSFTPATFDHATRTGSAEHTKFSVEEVLRGSWSSGPLDLVCVCSPHGDVTGPATGTQLILFAKYNRRDKIWEPADEVYELAATPALRHLILVHH